MSRTGILSRIQKLSARMTPQPIPVDQQPIAIAIMVAAVGSAASFVLLEGLMLVAVTGIAVAYRWRLLVAIQVLISMYLVYLSEFPFPSTPLFASGGVFFPNVLLPLLTAQWTAKSSDEEQPPSASWNSLLCSAIFVAALFVLTVLAFDVANASEPYRKYFAFYTHGIQLVTLVFLLGGAYILVRYAAGYYQISGNDFRQNRMHVHQTVHQIFRSEEWLLFRKRRKRRPSKLPTRVNSNTESPRP